LRIDSLRHREITHPDVTLLLRCAEEELLVLYPDEPASPVDPQAGFVVAYELEQPVGCGALAAHDDLTVEIKRMYVVAAHRRTGVARRIMAGLIERAADGGFKTVILETGTRQKAAIALYEGLGFERTEPYGEYVDNPYSVCYARKL